MNKFLCYQPTRAMSRVSGSIQIHDCWMFLIVHSSSLRIEQLRSRRVPVLQRRHGRGEGVPRASGGPLPGPGPRQVFLLRPEREAAPRLRPRAQRRVRRAQEATTWQGSNSFLRPPVPRVRAETGRSGACQEILISLILDGTIFLILHPQITDVNPCSPFVA